MKSLINPNMVDQLDALVSDLLKLKLRVVITVSGKRGSGKSTFGKYLRKSGVGGVLSRQIFLIDDGVLILKKWFFWKRVRLVCKDAEAGFLAPSLKYMRNYHKVVIIVTDRPTESVDWTDLHIIVNAADQIRYDRLIKRNGTESGKHRYNLSMTEESFDPRGCNFPYIHLLEIDNN